MRKASSGTCSGQLKCLTSHTAWHLGVWLGGRRCNQASYGNSNDIWTYMYLMDCCILGYVVPRTQKLPVGLGLWRTFCCFVFLSCYSWEIDETCVARVHMQLKPRILATPKENINQEILLIKICRLLMISCCFLLISMCSLRRLWKVLGTTVPGTT